MYSTEFTDEKYAAYVANFTTGDDMLFIRPSGNPMDMGQFRGMWSSGMITDAVKGKLAYEYSMEAVKDYL